MVEQKVDYDAMQERTFRKWANSKIKKKGFEPMENITEDFVDGIKLMELIHSLYDTPIPKHKKVCKTRHHLFDNVNGAFAMLEAAKVKTNFLKNTHLVDKDTKMLLGMVWSIILDYAIKGISEGELTAKKGLLMWIRKKINHYNHIGPQPGITNFTTNWKNGLALCALIHRFHPEMIDYDTLEKGNAAENIELAFSKAEELGIPRLLEVEDLLVARPNERQVMTYLAEFFHLFSQEDAKEVASRRVQKFLQFLKKMEGLQQDYEGKARALLEWTQSSQAGFQEEKAPANEEAAQNEFDKLKAFIVQEKPPKDGDKLDLELSYAKLQAELRVNGRKPYECPEDITPSAIDTAFHELESAVTEASKVIRENRFSFMKKVEYVVPDEKLAEIKQAFDEFDKDNSNALDFDEFKAALSGLSISLKDDKIALKVFKEVSEEGKAVSREQFNDYVVKLSEDKDSPEQIIESFKNLCGHNATITAAQLNVHPMEQEDIDFLVAKMEGEDGNLDYAKFVEENFNAE